MIRTDSGRDAVLPAVAGRTKLHVKVPASTANLGPGLDCYGLALELFNEIIIDLNGVPGVQHVGRDAALLRGQENLVQTAIRVFEGTVGLRVPPHALTQINEIPTTRGLGSSAASIIAGLVAANQLTGQNLSDPELLQIAGSMEGHADNVGASLYGGVVVSYRDGDRFHAVPVPLRGDLTTVVFVPYALLSTEAARAALPAHPPLADAMHNLGRSALLAVALQQGRFEYLAGAMSDRLHQPYRAPMVPGMSELISASVRAGAYGACLSGAGPSIIALTASESASDVAASMCEVAFEIGCPGEAMSLEICRDGAQYTWGVHTDAAAGVRPQASSARASGKQPQK